MAVKAEDIQRQVWFWKNSPGQHSQKQEEDG